MKPLILAVALAVTPPLAAHDFWLEPLAFELETGSAVAVALRVGEGFQGDTVMPATQSIADFRALDASGSRALERPALGEVAGVIAARQAGLLAIGYESRPSTLTLDAEPFENYLREEGLEHVIAQRAAHGDSALPGRELFARSSKSLVRVDGDSSNTEPLDAIGLPLEFVTAADPYTLSPGTSLELALLYRGQPAADVLVVALPKADPAGAHRGRTDSAGRLTVTLDRPGAWLIKAVHMDAAPPETDADWMSWWASLTFSIPEG